MMETCEIKRPPAYYAGGKCWPHFCPLARGLSPLREIQRFRSENFELGPALCTVPADLYPCPNIFQYAFVDGAPGGLKGPLGDVYLFSHFQVDAQGSYYLGKGLTFAFAGLNLNNAVFGFYQGSPQYFIQREYYKPTYTFRFRWELGRER